MEQIPAKERFNQNVKSVSTPVEILHEALQQFGMNPKTCEIFHLSGGFMNANFLASSKDKRVVLRVYATDVNTAHREFDLLQFLKASPVTAPEVFANFEIHQRPVLVMEYLDGITLEDRILNCGPLNLSIYESIGKELGEIHKIHFDRAGFIGPKIAIGSEFDNFSIFIGQFIERTLKNLEERPDKLDLETNLRFRRLVEEKWDMVVRTEFFPQLVHCDFNPKNIMVSRDENPKVLGIIDWEFTVSGNGLIDIGNFFRFFYDYPAEAKARFINGYNAANSSLHPDWESVSRLIDLGNMCGFLERTEDYQKSFRTARAVVKSTLEHFGY
ncbi:MAG TPA: aminoglycoside phosphotransferase family protein, partial [Pseudobdellovibrionaceae bacterium]|nr:aminoglycoside phosphotransferase family protein [Pseudobdellovibrionaceae bacterium]